LHIDLCLLDQCRAERDRICSVPSEPATDFMYIMSSTPLICSSNGADTFGDDFGIGAWISRLDDDRSGTTSGYSLTAATALRQAGDENDDRQHRCEDRAVDEEFGEIHVRAPLFAADATTAAVGSAPIATILGFTDVLGRRSSAGRRR